MPTWLHNVLETAHVLRAALKNMTEGGRLAFLISQIPRLGGRPLVPCSFTYNF